jgi:hypothetical protein
MKKQKGKSCLELGPVAELRRLLVWPVALFEGESDGYLNTFRR